MNSKPSPYRDILALLIEPGSVCEIRIPRVGGKKNRTIAGYFDNLDAAVAAVEQLDRRNDIPAIYATLNPVKPALLARAHNRTKDYADATTCDDHVLSRRWMLIDADPARPSGISSSEAEHATALNRVANISTWLCAAGWPAPVIGDSGNGGHLLYRVDLPNDLTATELIKQCLEALAFEFNDSAVGIDLTVFNAARISKVYGTMVRKGDHTPDRPHRRSALLSVPETIKPVQVDMLQRLAQRRPRPQPTQGSKSSGSAITSDIRAWLNDCNISILAEKQATLGGSPATIYKLDCVFNADHTGDAYLAQFRSGAVSYGCFHNSCSQYGWTDFYQKIDPERFNRRNSQPSEIRTASCQHVGLAPKPSHFATVADQYDQLSDYQHTASLICLEKSGISWRPLPPAAQLSPGAAVGASSWLERYIEFSRQWSPRSYDGFHEAVALWILSTVAARRVVLDLGGLRYTNLYIALCARTSLYAKSTVAKIGIDTLHTTGLAHLLAPDDATPQAFLHGMTMQVPSNYADMDSSAKQQVLTRLAFAAQRGWFYEEFGQKLSGMMRENGVMADFRGILRRFDDCPLSYTNETISRGADKIERPYLALLANLTPADLAPYTRRGASLWGDGFLARFALVVPPTDSPPSTARFPEGKRVIPSAITQPLRAWHERLGIPHITVTEQNNAKGESTGGFDVDIAPMTPHCCALESDVLDAFYRYHDALISLAGESEHTDLDGNYARFAEKALRIAMLLASLENDGRIELRHWAVGQNTTEHWRRDLHVLVDDLLETMHPTREYSIEEKVYRAFRREASKGKYELSAREVCRAAHISSGEAEQVLNRMSRQGEAIATQKGKTIRYTLKKSSELSQLSHVTTVPTNQSPVTVSSNDEIELQLSPEIDWCNSGSDVKSDNPVETEHDERTENAPSCILVESAVNDMPPAINLDYCRTQLAAGNERVVRVHCAMHGADFETVSAQIAATQ